VNQSIYQINPRTYLTSEVARGATLDDFPERLIHELSERGFEWLWLVGVWTIGHAGRAISKREPSWRAEYLEALPDLTDNDICGSPFAIVKYEVDSDLGGNEALARLRQKLSTAGIKLMLDFVPNHVALDHPWALDRPELLMRGSSADLKAHPDNWVELESGAIFAHGRDPNYPGWRDTLQLNFFNPDLRAAMFDELLGVAALADGVRCDMAMLIEPDIFHRTWGEQKLNPPELFPEWWPTAIAEVRKHHPEFRFMAEVYWGLEHRLQQHGFDYTYDKTLYDRVLARNGTYLRQQMIAPLGYQRRMARFLENHDEQRISSKLNPVQHKAAATLTYLAPGLRFFQHGQLSGKRLKTPIHLKRAPTERPNREVEDLYKTLLPIIHSPTGKHGSWHLLDTKLAWPDNPTHENFIAYLIEHPLRTIIVTVNYASYRGQCFIRIPDRSWLDGTIEFRDLLSQERLVRPAPDLLERGLFLDCDAWQTHIFAVESR
jgi:hypothetical protein